MLYILTALLMLFLYRLDGHVIFYNRIMSDYNKFKALNNLVATNHKNICIILWFSVCIIAKAMYINLIQYLNKSIRKINKNTYELTYVINGNTYKIRLVPKRGPKTIIQAIDENDVDITDTIQEYAGCSDDFHGYPFTPDLLGKKEITLHTASGVEKVFGSSDVLSLHVAPF